LQTTSEILAPSHQHHVMMRGRRTRRLQVFVFLITAACCLSLLRLRYWDHNTQALLVIGGHITSLYQ